MIVDHSNVVEMINEVETPGTEKEHNKQKEASFLPSSSLLPSLSPVSLPLFLSSFSSLASLGVTSPLGPFCFPLLNLFLLLLILAGDISTWLAGRGAESTTVQSKLPEPRISEQSSHKAWEDPRALRKTSLGFSHNP